MHIVQCLPCSILLSKSSDQWRKWQAHLVSSRIQACKQESMEPDLRWGADAAQPHVDFATLGSQSPSEDQQPMCAAAAMMHTNPRGASSSWQGGCPPIAEQQEWAPPMKQQHVILPNPGYKIEANIWHFDIRANALRPGSIASFLRHCNTMDSPPIPSYLRGGPQPADDIVQLSHEASMENLRELKRYARGFNLKRRVFVYGPMAFRIKIWMRQRRSRTGSQE